MNRRTALATIGMTWSSGCLWLEASESTPTRTAGDLSADTPGSITANDMPASEVTLIEHWSAEQGIDYIWTDGVKFYFNSFNAVAEATHGDGIRWQDDDVTYDDDTENLGANAFANTDRYAIFGFTPDHGESRCHFHAYDTVEGEEVWAYRVPDYGAFVNPVGVTIVDELAIIAGGLPETVAEPPLWGFDLGTGEPVWHGDDAFAAPSISFLDAHDGQLYVGTLGDGTYAVDPSDGSRQERHPSWDVREARIHGDSLFAVTMDQLAAHPIVENGVEWTTDITDVTTGPIVDNELVVVGTESGAIHAFDRATGEREWEQRLDGSVWALELSARRIWATDGETGLTAYDRTDGTILHRSTKPVNGSDIGISSEVILLGGGGARAYRIEDA